jgi:tetratricopeptide (TPR) repeat protein
MRAVCRRLLVATLLLAASATPGSPGSAQQTGEGQALHEGVGVQVDLGSGGSVQAAAPARVDERALRYYASQYDYARVDAEIARLKTLHPDWQPPRDLFGAPAPQSSEVDTSGLWAAYDRGDYGAVRSEINALRRINPTWEPPQKLLDLMAAAEVRAALKDAVVKGDWGAAIEVGRRYPRQIAPTPELIENLWLVAEAYHRSGDDKAAYALFGRVIEESDDAGLRLSTLQKALANRDDRRLAALLELERTRSRGADEQARLAQIESNIKGGGGGPAGPRSRLGTALPRVSSGQADVQELAQIAVSALELKHADAAQVLGWYHFDRRDWPEAERWFARSLEWQPAPSAAEGLARTYVEQRRFDEAEALARTWAPRAPGFARVIEQVEQQALWTDLDRRDPREILALTMRQVAAERTADPGSLVMHGWALYRLGRPGEAVRAFEQVYRDPGVAPERRSDAAYGLALAGLELGFTEDARSTLADATMSEEQRRNAQQALATREALDAYQAGRYEAALEAIDHARRYAPQDGGLAALEGWTLLELGRYTDAQRIFAGLDEAFRDAEARAGLRTIQTRQYPWITYQ